MNCVTLYKLTQFDNYSIGNPYKLSAPILKRGMTGESVRWLQYELNKKGYQVSIDGAFGPKTEEAVKAFQTKSFVDGVVGDLTFKKLGR